MAAPRDISDRLAEALAELVRATEAARSSAGDRQAARRAIEQAAVVARLARDEGFGGVGEGGEPRE
jgi:hypothetical protein